MKALFTAQPGHGHLEPLLPAARALVEAGHDVRIGTSASAVPLVADRGVPAVSVGVDWLMAEPERAFPSIRGRRGAEGKHYLLTEIFCGVTALATARDLVALAERWRPDVIVREIWEFGGALAAAHLGVPSALHGIGTWRNVEEVLDAGAGRLHQAWRDLGHRGGCGDSVRSRLYLDPCPPFLQTPAAPAWPLPRQPLRAVPTSPAGAVPRGDGGVLVTLGTVMHRRPGLLESIVDGVAGLDRPVVATTGPGIDPARLERRPSGVSVVEHLPLAELLTDAAVVVCHGGWGTVLAALGHGIPLVIVPLGSDNATNAARCEEAGVSITVEHGPQLTDAVRAAVRSVLDDPGYRHAAGKARDAIARMPDPGHAAAGLVALAG